MTNYNGNNGPQTSGTPTPERYRQNGGVINETIDYDLNSGGFVNRYKAVWECPLDAYRDYGAISEPEYQAGLHFQRAYYGAAMSRRHDAPPTTAQEASMEETMHDRILKQAYTTVPPETLGTVVAVCGHAEPAQNLRALENLRRGLGHLAVRWHMAAIEVCEHKRR